MNLNVAQDPEMDEGEEPLLLQMNLKKLRVKEGGIETCYRLRFTRRTCGEYNS